MVGPVVSAVTLDQNGHTLFCFAMNSRLLRRICYVTPRSKNDPEEVQRLLDKKRAKQIGEYLKDATALLPNAIVVSLTDEVQITPTADPRVNTLTFPADEGKFAYILDGQHRLGGFEYSEGKEFDLPVVALAGADETLRGKVFADINSKQEKVSDVHLLSLYYQIGESDKSEKAVMDVLTKLNNDPNSPLHRRIKMLDDDKDTWIKNSAMKRLVAPYVTSGGILAAKSAAEQAQILKNYFRAVETLWPDAWGKTKDFNLCRTLGFEIVLGIFGQVKYRCDLNRGKQYTPDNLAAMMKPLVDVAVSLPGGAEIHLDWLRGGSMRLVGNQAMKSLVTRELKTALIAEDEDKDAAAPVQ